MKKIVLIFLLLFCIDLISSATIGSSNSKGVIINQVQSTSSNGDTNNYYVGGVNASTTTCSGTDKISSYNNATGVFTCTTDQTGGGGSSFNPLQYNPTFKRQLADIGTTSNVTWVNTDMMFDIVQGYQYNLQCDIMYTSVSATIGQSINLSSNFTSSNVNILYDTWSSATANVGLSALVFNTNLQGTGSGATIIKPNLIIADFTATSNGTLRLLMRSEMDLNLTTLLRGSLCKLTRVDGLLSVPVNNATGYFPAIKRQSYDLNQNSTGYWNITNISFDLTTGKKYNLICDILFNGSVATTGQAINLTFNGTYANANVMYDTWSSATAPVGLSATVFNTALIGTGSGAGIIRPNQIVADFETTSNGTLRLLIRTEITATYTGFMRGSMCSLYDVT